MNNKKKHTMAWLKRHIHLGSPYVDSYKRLLIKALENEKESQVKEN